MSDILEITETQARVLRSIAYYEIKSNMKGATQYACSKKVSNGLHVSGSTFNDNIKGLEKNLMVLQLKEETGDRETKPYSITDIGQIAWIRHFPLKDNMKIIQEVFPKIRISAINEIINEINHSEIKKIKDSFAITVLDNALNSFHINNSLPMNTNYFKPSIEEVIELSEYYDLKKISYKRHYCIIHPSLYKEFRDECKDIPNLIKNFDELDISIIERITFLFYYNLIQSVIEPIYAFTIIEILSRQKYENNQDKKISNLDTFKSLSDSMRAETKTEIYNASTLSLAVTKKKKKILKTITSDTAISSIMKKNLKELNNSKDKNFEEITNTFI